MTDKPVTTTAARCRLCAVGAHEFCERIFDPADDACMCSHDPALDPADDTLIGEGMTW